MLETHESPASFHALPSSMVTAALEKLLPLAPSLMEPANVELSARFSVRLEALLD